MTPAIPTPQAIVQMLTDRRWADLRATLARLPAPEIADLLRALGTPDRSVLFRALSREPEAEVFAHLTSAEQDALLRELTDDETRSLLANLPPDDRTHLLEEMPGRVTQRLVNLLSQADLREARELLGYPDESVGRLMTPDYVAIRPAWTVDEAIAHVRQRGTDSETIDVVYVVDADWRLVDEIELRRLILAEPATMVEGIMDHSFVSVPAGADREEAVRLMTRYGLSVLPVVDSQGVLLGIVTVDDALSVAEEEATEDFHRVGSVGPLHMSLKDASLGLLYRRRIGWLLTLVLVNIFSGAGIAYFENTIAATVALVTFLPLLIDSGGNAGSQSATLAIRALATGDAVARDWLRLVTRELATAMLIGLTMAGAVSLLGVIRAPEIVPVVAVTMLVVVVAGSLLGLSLPFVFTRVGWDPATASGPLITSMADILGVFVYLSVATWYLGATLASG
ncbi:MAG: magnesium transporter [Vicinamibacterales bacterium]|nr:magnesium transporter [Vicinamibacterales bacterium]